MTSLAPGAAIEHRSVAYTIEIDRVNVCHLGDITVPLTPKQVDELAPVDVLLLPTGGSCTLELDQTLQAMQDLDPKIVIPMHHKIEGVNLSIQGVEVFLRQMGLDDVEPQGRLVVTSPNLPADRRVVLLSPSARQA